MIKQIKLLFWKEWLIFKPYTIFMAVILVLNLIYEACTSYVEEFTIWNFVTESGIDDYFIFMYIACLGLYTKERDEGTQYFLHGLPLSRGLSYTVKSVMPTGILTIYFCVALIITLVLATLVHGVDAVAKDFHYLPPLFITSLAHLIVCGIVFSTLSFLRRWGLIVFVFCVSILWMFKLEGWQFVNYFDFFSICDPPENYGDEWLIPWGHIGALLNTSLLLWLIGFKLYCIPYGYFDQILHRYRAGFWPKIVPVAFIAAIVVGVSLFGFASYKSVDGVKKTVDRKLPQRSDEQQILQKRSRHLRWTILSKHEKRYNEIFRDCEKAYKHVVDFLEIPIPIASTRVQVDACNPLKSHAGGVAHWKKLRLNFELYTDNADVLAVFGHEITHVFIDLVTKQRLRKNFKQSRWFHEGLATYVENRFYGDFKDTYTHLALAASWNEIHFNELLDNDELTRERDTNLVYPVGMLWFESLVSAYGDDAPAKLLKVLNKKDSYDRIRDLTSWRSICQDAGFNLEMVRDTFNKRLKQLVDEHRTLCDTFPELTKVTVEQTGETLIITPELPPDWEKLRKAGATLRLNATLDKDKSSHTFMRAQLRKDNTFHISNTALTKNELYFQIGVKPRRNLNQAIYGEWSKVKIKP